MSRIFFELQFTCGQLTTSHQLVSHVVNLDNMYVSMAPFAELLPASGALDPQAPPPVGGPPGPPDPQMISLRFLPAVGFLHGNCHLATGFPPGPPMMGPASPLVVGSPQLAAGFPQLGVGFPQLVVGFHLWEQAITPQQPRLWLTLMQRKCSARRLLPHSRHSASRHGPS